MNGEMMRLRNLIFLLVWLSFLMLIEVMAEDLHLEEAEKLFVHRVFPLIKAKCFTCHGSDPNDIRDDLDLTHREKMIDRKVLIPDDAEMSPIYIAVTWQDKNLEMPPKENDRLSTVQVDLIRQWIEAGAPWPSPDRWEEIVDSEWITDDGIFVKTSGGLADEWTHRLYQPEDLWVFQPIKQLEVPSNDAEHPIDAFINQKLKDAGIKPASKADKLLLIRRATFDLIGLPPTPDEVDTFLADDAPDAFDKVVDRLLANPNYGEQWGRQWLDVVRYADTSGFSNDFERPNAWRYRDYVIRSFNQDKPYDQFVREQLAGDEIDPTDPEMLIAVGFLRMGPWEQTGMTIATETRQFYLDDVTNAIGETFMSIPLRCARCHDHKFDPIPTKDYYRLQAVFAPLQFADRDVDYLPEENQQGFEVGRQRIQLLLDQAKADRSAISKKEENAARKWMEARGLTYQTKNERNKLPVDQRAPRYYGLTYQDLGRQKALHKQIQILQWQLERYQAIAFSVYNGPWINKKHISSRLKMPQDLTGDLQPTYILAGGSVYAPDERVTAGTLSAVQSLTPIISNQIDPQVQNKRTQLAEWITDPENPLTTRSIVNRIWQHHFGVGLAGNANNLGKMGKKPTHPKLLDWLARNFVDNSWSIKNLHRLIMMSDAYQRSSHYPLMDYLKQKDPDNKLLAYFQPRRLRSEELRDSMLFVSGELNTEMGGLPVFPEINMEVAMQPRHVMGSIAPAYQPSPTPEQRNRRTIYVYRYRGLSDPMLEVFNQPSADISCERRTSSTVTPQVFTLFNSQNSYRRALAMAQRLVKERSQLSEQIQCGVQLAWCRNAEPDEVRQSVDFVEKMIDYHQQHPPAVQADPVAIERTMFEEMTGEPFTYTEQLDIYQNYTPDSQPWTVPVEIRALADFCLLLLNANEFVYVY